MASTRIACTLLLLKFNDQTHVAALQKHFSYLLTTSIYRRATGELLVPMPAV